MLSLGILLLVNSFIFAAAYITFLPSRDCYPNHGCSRTYSTKIWDSKKEPHFHFFRGGTGVLFGSNIRQAYGLHTTKDADVTRDHDMTTTLQERNQQEFLSFEDEDISVDVEFILSHYINATNNNEERDSILRKVDEEHAADMDLCASLGKELLISNQKNNANLFSQPSIPAYEWIHEKTAKDEDYPIAIRTVAHEPLLNDTCVNILVSAAEDYWEQESRKGSDGTTSRFTYQQPGNAELHVADLALANSTVHSIMTNLLSHQLYPLVRHAFDPILWNHDEATAAQFCVYDSLLIKYNATEANGFETNAKASIKNNTANQGAGQPLHRDLGLVSVNVMLNARDEFQGGGTFFENQLLALTEDNNFHDDVHSTSMGVEPTLVGMDISSITPTLRQLVPEPLIPNRKGHAIAHLSSERHAGAGTTAGIRYIMVLFLSANFNNSANESVSPRQERSARLKSNARLNCEESKWPALCRAAHHWLAVQSVPTDGEAWHYLGMALLDHHDEHQHSTLYKNERDSNAFYPICPNLLLRTSVKCLEQARKLTPCDSRLYNTLGLALERYAQQTPDASNPVKPASYKKKQAQQISQAYRTALSLVIGAQQAGCNNVDFCSSCLNYGLYFANLDRFTDAVQILTLIDIYSPPATNDHHSGSSSSQNKSFRIRKDASRLRDFCQDQVSKLK
eukprot:scaffold9504_cov49-Attheya_sp.AAC.5